MMHLIPVILQFANPQVGSVDPEKSATFLIHQNNLPIAVTERQTVRHSLFLDNQAGNSRKELLFHSPTIVQIRRMIQRVSLFQSEIVNLALCSE
jgi:hypothetical protein